MQLSHCIIILNYNDWKSCVKLALKIKNYENISSVVIVDNKSSDDSLAQLCKCFSRDANIHILESNFNGGYAHGNNLGCYYAIKELGAQYITIANPDIYFTQETMQEILLFLKNNCREKVGSVTCTMHCHSDIDLPSAWKVPMFMDCVMENLILLRRLIGDRTRYPEKYFMKDCIQVEAVAGSYFSMRSEVFRDIGGLDSETFLYYEENILARKLIDSGYKNYLLPQITYEHMHSVSIDKTFGQIKAKLDLAYESRRLYVSKYLNCSRIKLSFLHVTYIIGRTDYLLADWLRQTIKAIRGKNCECQ